MKNLAARTLFKVLVVALGMGLLVFMPAGTLRYWQAWAYLPTFLGASLLITIDLIRRDPALLERRSKGGPKAEKRPEQKIIMLLASIGFAGLLLVGPRLSLRLVFCAGRGRPRRRSYGRDRFLLHLARLPRKYICLLHH